VCRIAIIEGVLTRVLRPIFNDCVNHGIRATTILLATLYGGDGPPYAPIAIAIIGGLLSALLPVYFLALAYLLVAEIYVVRRWK